MPIELLMTLPNVELKYSVIPGTDLIRLATLNLLHSPISIEERVKFLAEEINRTEIDVLCLQEVLSEKQAGFDIVEFLCDNTNLSFGQRGITTSHKGLETGNATLTRFEDASFVQHSYVKSALHVSPAFGNIIEPVITSLIVNGVNVHIFNVHYIWGSGAERTRVRQAEQLVRHVEHLREVDPHCVCLMAGDFNSVPDALTMQFLYGLQESPDGATTLWVDAWKIAGNAENEITNDPETYWAKETCKAFNLLNVDLIPKRRIDYILSYEWCYGKTGSPVRFDRWANNQNQEGLEISDHFGIWADIYIPNL